MSIVKTEPGLQIDLSLQQLQLQELLFQIPFVQSRSSTWEQYCQAKEKVVPE